MFDERGVVAERGRLPGMLMDAVDELMVEARVRLFRLKVKRWRILVAF